MSEAHGQRILLVTDDADLALVLRRLLEAEGYEVEPCPDTMQAYVLYQMDPCGAVLFDLAVRGEMSPHAFCHAIRELDSRAALVGMSQKPIRQVDEEVLRLLGTDALLQPSFTVNQLLFSIREAADRRRGRGETAYLAACGACGTSHRVSAASLARRQSRVQCPNCNNLFRVDPESLARAPSLTTHAGPSRGRILVMDDARFFRLFLYEVLTEAGFRVVLAEGGKEGLELAKRWWPDVAVVDVTMPGMNGLEVLRRIKSVPGPDRPAVLMVTSFSAPEYRLAAEEAGADGYLLKPIAVEAFVAEVARLVDRKGQTSKIAA